MTCLSCIFHHDSPFCHRALSPFTTSWGCKEEVICYSTSEREMFPQPNRGLDWHIKSVCLLVLTYLGMYPVLVKLFRSYFKEQLSINRMYFSF